MLHVILRLSDEVRFLDSGGVYRTPDTGGSRSEIPAPAGKDLNRHARNQRSACEHLAAPLLLIVIPTGAARLFPTLDSASAGSPRGMRGRGVEGSWQHRSPLHNPDTCSFSPGLCLSSPKTKNQQRTTKDFCSHCHRRKHRKRITATWVHRHAPLGIDSGYFI